MANNARDGKKIVWFAALCWYNIHSETLSYFIPSPTSGPEEEAQ